MGDARPRTTLRRALPLGTATLLALACLTAQAQTASQPVQQPLRVVTEDSSYSTLVNGEVVGPASDIVKKTLALAGVNDYRMTLYPWARAYDMARLQPNVLIYPILRSPEREKLFKWVGELDRVTPNFYKLRERRNIAVHSLQDAKAYPIGVVRDDSRQTYLEDHGFKRLVVSYNNLDNLKKLLSGQVALIPMPEREAREQCDELHIAFEDLENVYVIDDLAKGLFVAMSTSTPEDTVQRVSIAFAKLKDDGTVANVLATH